MKVNFRDKNFVIATFFRDYFTRTFCASLAASAIASARALSTWPRPPFLNFREENFRDRKSNHEIHENIAPRKFGAIRYLIKDVHVARDVYMYL